MNSEEKLVKQCTVRTSVLCLTLCTALPIALGTASSVSGDALPCLGGMVDGYPCSDVILVSHLSEADLGTSGVSDNWGWNDPKTGTEYAILAAVEGTLFVSLEDPVNPVLIGTLPTHSATTLIRDLKVFADHAFIVADTGGHGMQIFDLSQLRSVTMPPITFAETAHYDGISDAHNIALNPTTGFAYPMLTDTCSGGLHMLDLAIPTAPVFVGCYDDAGSLHDAVCFLYDGPDVEHQGREICIGADLSGAVAIADVTDKANPDTLSMEFYNTASISHQGWITADQRYYFHGDEGDEGGAQTTRTYVWDIQDLDNPSISGTYSATTLATDHNQYVSGNYLYQANYTAGLRVLELGDLSVGELTEVAFLDTRPGEDDSLFGGAWSVYPYFASGNLIVTDTREGLFVVQVAIAETIFEDGFESGDVTAWSTTVP
jgi:choice-of-anchor B domain-containing protein